MIERARRNLRRATIAVCGAVPALVLGVAPVNASARPIETVRGICHYQAGTVEGAAVAFNYSARQTGIVCNVYENGQHIGGCGGALPTTAATCVGPVIGVGPPVVCTYAWALYGDTMVTDEHCE